MSQQGHPKEFQKLRKDLGQPFWFFPLAYFVRGTLVFYDIIFKKQTKKPRTSIQSEVLEQFITDDKTFQKS